jgi:hypothetical protein
MQQLASIPDRLSDIGMDRRSPQRRETLRARS